MCAFTDAVIISVQKVGALGYKQGIGVMALRTIINSGLLFEIARAF